ncbi:KH domain-containing protein [bacterium]|nr:KH domain-containing protein [candidate division CSSED10-310 bacterium]
MKSMVESISKLLVECPDQVHVDEVTGSKTTIINLAVDPGDVGRIIGKNGRTIRALRTLLNAAAVRENKRVVLEIIENE